jgi:hypothetical protein
MTFSLIRDGEFNVNESAGNGLCYICSCRKQPGDLGIFRGPAIDYEGNLDVCQRCIVTAAHEAGMISSAKAEEQDTLIHEHESQINVLKNLNAEQDKLIKSLEGVKDARTRLGLPSPPKGKGRVKVA